MNGLYQVSNFGRVKSLSKKAGTSPREEKILKHSFTRTGYLRVCLRKDNKNHAKNIHNLVANAFIENKENKPQINHVDGDKTNNHVNNLEWVTRSENINHAYKNGLIQHKTREVIQYDMEMKYIKTWNSIKAASKELNILQSNITLCCQEKIKYAKGYIWRYKEGV